MGIRVGVFFGGRSVEHEVSVISAIQAMNAFDRSRYDVFPVYIDRAGDMRMGPGLDDIASYRDIPALVKRCRRFLCLGDGGRFYLTPYHSHGGFGLGGRVEIDVAFPVVHGTTVEDGDLQGLFKTVGIPFVGCDVTASALGMDKYYMKAALRFAGLPVLDCVRLSAREYFEDSAGALSRIEEAAAYPAIVKPVNLGSSVGIGKASDREGLREALEHAFLFANAVVAERAVVDLREINCAVLGDDDVAEASECEEPLNTDAILSYSDKYGSGGKGGGKGMSGARRRLPADIPVDVRARIRDLAVETFRAIGANGVSRVDFLMDGASGEIWVNEINTIPGSLAFYLFEKVGVSYSELLHRLVDLAFKRRRSAAQLSYAFETDILSNFVPGGSKGTKAPERGAAAAGC